MIARWYLVASPVYEYVEPVLDDGSGPTERARDVVYVRARNRKRARIVALRHFRKLYVNRPWKRPPYLIDEMPFVGMSVERVEEGIL